MERQSDSAPSLTVVGLGIAYGAHLTPEARQSIQHSDVVLVVGADPLVHDVVASLNPNSRSLSHLYEPGKQRSETYREMVQAVLQLLDEGNNVCLAVYGHPTMYASPGRFAVREARERGAPARIVPGISAEACMLADLQLDPGQHGWQSYEATDFLIRDRAWDHNTPLVLWQITTIGATEGRSTVATEGLRILTQRLAAAYGEDHKVTIYLASQFPGIPPFVRNVALDELPSESIPTLATLFVPPAGSPPTNWDLVERLGLDLGR